MVTLAKELYTIVATHPPPWPSMDIDRLQRYKLKISQPLAKQTIGYKSVDRKSPIILTLAPFQTGTPKSGQNLPCQKEATCIFSDGNICRFAVCR